MVCLFRFLGGIESYCNHVLEIWMVILLQGFQMGIALPEFLLNIDGASGGILLLWIVGVCILLPLVIAVIYLSRSSKYTGNYVMHQTLSTYYYLMKPSLAPRYTDGLSLFWLSFFKKIYLSFPC